jgi:hypothetical protein
MSALRVALVPVVKIGEVAKAPSSNWGRPMRRVISIATPDAIVRKMFPCTAPALPPRVRVAETLFDASLPVDAENVTSVEPRNDPAPDLSVARTAADVMLA